MPNKLKFRIRNWKLALLALFLFCVFIGLGMWQLTRANLKQQLLNTFTERTLHSPFSARDLSTIKDWRFYRVQLTGTFDNKHTFLLDNKIHLRQVGYEVYTPFNAEGMSIPILVDRGFMPLTGNRATLPAIPPIDGTITFIGILNLPPLYVTLGKMSDTAQAHWPLRVEYIQLASISKILNVRLFPYVVAMDAKNPRAYAAEWLTPTMSPERHRGYAVQWFALALTLLILFVALNRAQ